MTDKEAFYEFARGFTVGLGIIGVMVLFLTMITPNDPTPEKKFEVVDRYKQCDVVRYTDPSTRWNYFLDCSEVR
jgi:hypothetical protein